MPLDCGTDQWSSEILGKRGHTDQGRQQPVWKGGTIALPRGGSTANS